MKLSNEMQAVIKNSPYFTFVIEIFIFFCYNLFINYAM